MTLGIIGLIVGFVIGCASQAYHDARRELRRKKGGDA